MDEKKKPKDDKLATERTARIESYLRDHNHKDADDYARVLHEVALQNIDLIKDQFDSESIPQAALLYDTYLKAARLLYLSKNNQLRKDKLLAYYDENRQHFPLVLRELLEAEDLYNLTKSKERRDFIVKLVTKMVKHWQPKLRCDMRALRDKVQKSH